MYAALFFEFLLALVVLIVAYEVEFRVKFDFVYLVLMRINLSFIKYLKSNLKILFFLYVLFYMHIMKVYAYIRVS
jgi:hypothetical protein